MDINQAKTFLTVAETGSFIDAARRLSLTQSTVSARIRTLEEQLNRELFERSKDGATLTTAGEQFRRHALALVRIWHTAQIEVSKYDSHRDRLSVGAPRSLWDDFLINWISWLRCNIADIAVDASAMEMSFLTQGMLDGTLDMAITYRPVQLPGLVSEHLFDEEYILVTSVKAGNRRRANDYIFLQWANEFQTDHAAAYPEHTNPGLRLDIGAIGLEYFLATPASGYCPRRLAHPHLKRGRLRTPTRSRRFIYPVYMVYPEARDEDAFEPILNALRRESAKIKRQQD